MAKRLFDVVLSLAGLLFLAPALFVIALLVKFDSSGPVFYRQERIGLSSKPFRIFKFRTMIDGADRKGLKVTIGGDPRVTRTGAMLRKYKLDELPQLINVLKGEMSFVGPRPEVEEYVKYYTEADRRIIHSVRPGITDPASIEFRDENDLLKDVADPEKEYISRILPRKIRLYRSYIEDRSFWMDIRLIAKTIFMVAR